MLVTSTARRGAEVFAWELSRALGALGLQTELRALTSPGGEGLPIPALGRLRAGPLTLMRARGLARRSDVLVGHGSSTLPVGVAAAARSAPFVYRSVGDPRYWAGSAARRARAGWLMRRADRVVALTEGAAQALREVYGLDEQRVVVIPRAVPAESFPEVTPESKAAARRKLQVPPEVPAVLFVGALSPEKQPELAVRSVAELPSAHLIVVGAGPRWEAVARLAVELLPGRHSFAGVVSDVSECYRAADVLLLTSATEGMPGVVMEAGMTGIPSVATDVGWVREIVRDGDTGLVVREQSPECIASALESALSERERLGRGARADYLGRFALGPVAKQWSDLLQEVCR